MGCQATNQVAFSIWNLLLLLSGPGLDRVGARRCLVGNFHSSRSTQIIIESHLSCYIIEHTTLIKAALQETRRLAVTCTATIQ
jgi:hypothetical protein